MIDCPHCGAELEARGFEGRETHCIKCQGRFFVPFPTAAAAPVKSGYGLGTLLVVLIVGGLLGMLVGDHTATVRQIAEQNRRDWEWAEQVSRQTGFSASDILALKRVLQQR